MVDACRVDRVQCQRPRSQAVVDGARVDGVQVCAAGGPLRGAHPSVAVSTIRGKLKQSPSCSIARENSHQGDQVDQSRCRVCTASAWKHDPQGHKSAKVVSGSWRSKLGALISCAFVGHRPAAGTQRRPKESSKSSSLLKGCERLDQKATIFFH